MRGLRPTRQWQGQENAQATHHLQFTAAPATESTFPTHPISGTARTCRAGGEFGPHADAGESSTQYLYLYLYIHIDKLSIM